jgi:hypothetical protein
VLEFLLFCLYAIEYLLKGPDKLHDILGDFIRPGFQFLDQASDRATTLLELLLLCFTVYLDGPLHFGHALFLEGLDHDLHFIETHVLKQFCDLCGLLEDCFLLLVHF